VRTLDNTQTLEMQILATSKEAISKLDQLYGRIDKLSSPLNKATTNIGKLSTAFKGLFGINVTKQLTKQVMSFFEDVTNRAEELNLFNVIFKNIEKNGEKTFSELGKEATQFQYRLNEKFGTNLTETMRYQGLFQAMATNQGIAEKYAAVMSESMTKLTYDLASLYNRSEKTTAEALRGGVYAGQTKPLVI